MTRPDDARRHATGLAPPEREQLGENEPSGGVEPDGLTLTPTADVMRRWRSGPRWYHVLAVMIDDEAVERRRELVLRELSDCARPSAPGQAHVTLCACGSTGAHELAETPEVGVRVGGVGLFRSAVYLRTEGSDLASVRGRLGAPCGPAPDVDWTPHVTAGVFTAAVPLDSIRRRLARFTDLPPLAVAGRLRLMAVDTRSDVGALRPAGRPAGR